jgi:hypothetical protein
VSVPAAGQAPAWADHSTTTQTNDSKGIEV